MKKFLLCWLTLLLAICVINCQPTKPSNQNSASDAGSAVNQYQVSLQPTGQINPAQPVKLTLQIQDGAGRAVNPADLEIVHEKIMHLIVVSQDLSFFNHIHPEPSGNGLYTVETEFPAPGRYQLYLDYNPLPVGHRLAQLSLMVAGTPPTPLPLIVDNQVIKTVDNLTVALQADRPWQSETPMLLTFLVSDPATSAPIHDLQPYLGAFAHFVIISEDTKQFLHAHPLEEADPLLGAVAGGPKVNTRVIFPTPGRYKLWAQFQRNNRVITVSYVIKIEPGAATVAADAINEGGVQKLQIKVNERGFEPNQIQLKRGLPAQLTFYRENANNCAQELLITELGLRKPLPVGVPVTIELKPDRDITYNFSCGMGMLRGTIKVSG